MPTLVEIGSVDLKKIFINFVNAFFIFLLSLPGKEQSPSFEQTYFTFTQGWIVLSLVESDSGEDDEHVKSLRKRQRQGQQRRRRRTTDTF